MPDYLYERRLLNEPKISRKLADIYYGYAEPQTVVFEFSNVDGFFSNLIATEEIRNTQVRLRLYEPNNNPKITFQLSGIITDFTIDSNDICSITVSINNPDPLQTNIARKVLETSDWSWGVNPTSLIYLPTQDLGKSYPLCFGYCRKVPLVYVRANHTAGQKAFDYIVSYGEIDDIVTLYRNKRVINMAAEGITYNKGTSASPYSMVLNGQTVYFAYVRFPLEQKDFNGNFYEITADVKGMKFGEANMEKNFANIIRHILSNQAWGLNLPINLSSFLTAASQVASVYPESNDYVNNLDGGCSGNISAPIKAYDLLSELLTACRGKLDINANNQWELTIDTYQHTAFATFGENDGYYNNAEFLSLSRTPTSEAIKKIIINYANDNWTKTYAHKNERTLRAFGEEKTYDFILVRDHTTADRISSYLGKIETHDHRIKIRAGMEARELKERDIVWLIKQDWGIEGRYKIKNIEKGTNEFILDLTNYSHSIYQYTPGNLPAEPYNDAEPDYSNTPPSAPTSLQKVSDGTMQATDGGTAAFIILSAVIPSTNAAKILFGYKRTSDVNYTITEGQQHSGTTWRGRIDGLTPGIAYDYIAYTENSFGLRSTGATLTNQTAPGDTTPPGTVTGLIGRGKYKTVEFSWTALTVSDLRGYRVQLNSASGFNGTMYFDSIVDQPKFSYTSDSLSYNQTLYCRVKGVDYTGNESTSWSTTATATTSAVGNTDLGDNIVTETKISNLAVTNAKINDLSANKINAGRIYISWGNVCYSAHGGTSGGTLDGRSYYYTPTGFELIRLGSGSSGSIYAMYINSPSDSIQTYGGIHTRGLSRGIRAVAGTYSDSIAVVADGTYAIELSGKISLYTPTATSASAGSFTVPTQCAGYLLVEIEGNQRKIPFFT